MQTNYRAFLLDDEGHVFSALPLDCQNDEEALAKAKQLLNGRDIEVWELGRMVGTLRHKPLTEN